MIRVAELKLRLNEKKDVLKIKVAEKLHIKPENIEKISIYKESLDARKKDDIHFVYTVDCVVKNEKGILAKCRNKNVSITPDMDYKYVECKNNFSKQPVIIGFGPAGMFAALILAQMGHKPIVLERGQDVDKRTEAVEKFWKTGILDTENNVQFGEGGAGTFSDGKLTTRIKDLRCRKVMEELIKAGAPDEILYKSKPHVGTDLLKGVVKNIRNTIISLGGEIHFGAKVTDIIIENQKIKAVEVNNQKQIFTDHVILAVGHSARDIFEMLKSKNVTMEQKPFAMGVRIEHKQKDINFAQYGDEKLAEILGAADYRLTYTTKNGRGVFSFCMCPGGQVVAAASEENMVAVNGMSYHARNDENANSALLVQVYPEDFKSDDVLSGMYLQRNLEKLAYKFGGENYNAPAQKVGDFLNNVSSESLGDVKNSYRPDVKLCNLNDFLPDFMTEALKEAIPEMGKKLKGFDNPQALMTAVESRSSSPVRILRNSDTFESENIKGLFPAGEGAGYAGGIVSAAVDGIVAAEKVVLSIK